jgi:rhodanese-related sulfurtransferase
MSTLLPLLQGTFPPVAEFIPALIIGMLFGAALEVAGFGNARFLAGQFYFHDLRVFKVMFTAIITAAVGVAMLTATGLLSMGLLYVPDTFLIPLLVGGLVLGAGFMLSAYCPGTSIVGAASGKWDGLVTVAGVIVGSAAFNEMYPFIRGFYTSTARGVLTFPTLLGIPFPVLVAVLTAGAVFAFFGADKLEGIFARRLNMPQGDKMTASGKKALAAVFSLSVIAVVFQYALPSSLATATPGQVAEVTPIRLAQMLIEEPRSLYIVDLRKSADPGAKESIPQSVRFGDIKDSIDGMYKGRTMVVYSRDGKEALQREVFRFKGRIVQLAGGFDAWKSRIMGSPEETYQAALNATDSDDRRMVSAIHASFTGTKVEAPAETGNKPALMIMAPKKRGGGCS